MYISFMAKGVHVVMDGDGMAACYPGMWANWFDIDVDFLARLVGKNAAKRLIAKSKETVK